MRHKIIAGRFNLSRGFLMTLLRCPVSQGRRRLLFHPLEYQRQLKIENEKINLQIFLKVYILISFLENFALILHLSNLTYSGTKIQQIDLNQKLKSVSQIKFINQQQFEYQLIMDNKSTQIFLCVLFLLIKQKKEHIMFVNKSRFIVAQSCLLFNVYNFDNIIQVINIEMEDILKAIYHREGSRMTREVTPFRKKTISYRKDTQYLNQKARYSQVLSNYTQSTNHESTDDNQSNRASKQRNVNKSIDLRRKFHTIELSKIQKPQNNNQVHLPSIRRKNTIKYQSKSNKFRVAGHVLTFIVKLKRARKRTLLQKKNKSLIMSSQLLKLIDKMVRGYYISFLQQQLSYYVSLLELKIESPDVDLSKQIVNNLYFIAKRLAESTIRKDFLDFLLNISRSTSFFPTQFLSQLQMVRLEFSTKMGSLINVTKQQTRMIVGIFIGIKVFCSYILYRPWHLNLSKIDFEKQFHKIQQLISNAGSVFYYLILDQFTAAPEIFLKEHQKDTLKKFKIQPMKKINIYPAKKMKYFDQQTDEQLFPNQTRDFFKKLMRNDRQKLLKIKGYLMKWIDRITNLIYKNSDADLYMSVKKQNNNQSQSLANSK